MAVALHDGSNLNQLAAIDAAGNVSVVARKPSGSGLVFKTIKAQSVTSGTPVGVWTPASGKSFRLLGFMLSLSVAGAILFEDTTGSSNEFLRTGLLAAGVAVASPDLQNGYLSSAPNNELFIDVTANGTVSGFIFGDEE